MHSWWRRTGSELLWSWDVGAGALVWAGVLIWGYFNPAVVPGTNILSTEALIGGALLAVVLTALAILVAFLGEEYVALLEKSVGVRKAIIPYQSVASVAGAQILVALAAWFTWPVAHIWGRLVLSSFAQGLVVCSVIGTVQIVNITAGHGKRRAKIPEIRDAARRGLRERDRQSNAS